MALVEPLMAMSVLMALSNEAGERMSLGFKSSHTISTIRRPAMLAMRGCAVTTAGIEEAAGMVMPRTSAMALMVEAVPIVMQVPAEGAMASSISPQASSHKLPAQRSAQYFHTSVPEPSVSVPQRAGSIGPAGTKIVGSRH